MSASPTRQTHTLVIVAKYPAPGQVKTRLGAAIGNSHATALYTAFLRDLAVRFDAPDHPWALRWAVAPGARPAESLREIVGLDACVFQQRGEDFADRLYHICEDARALGARRLAIMSSDAPQLPAALVARAFAALDRVGVAISPAEDGGYSLIALHLPDAPAAPSDLFRGIQMSTPTVLAETLARAAALGLRVRRLETTFDVDEAADLGRLWLALRATPWLAPHSYAALVELIAAPVRDIAGIAGNEDAYGDIASRW
jgi:rSAM/selenodomain-associated transferase 1